MKDCKKTEHLGYRLTQSKDSNTIQARVPLIRGIKERCFRSLVEARKWQNDLALMVWGRQRWDLVQSGRLRMLRTFGSGVSVRIQKSQTRLTSSEIAEYKQFGVFWYDNSGAPKSKIFSLRRYGEYAELHAHWFAAHQRAIMTFSTLNLPAELSVFSFDLHAAVMVKEDEELTSKYAIKPREYMEYLNSMVKKGM